MGGTPAILSCAPRSSCASDKHFIPVAIDDESYRQYLISHAGSKARRGEGFGEALTAFSREEKRFVCGVRLACAGGC